MLLPGILPHGAELSDSQLMEALGRHGGCWEGTEIDPFKVILEITRILTMRHEPTTRNGVDAVHRKLQEYSAVVLWKHRSKINMGAGRKDPRQ